MSIPLALPNFASIIHGIGGYLNSLIFNSSAQNKFPKAEQPKNTNVTTQTAFVPKNILVESPIVSHCQWISDNLQSKLLTQVHQLSTQQNSSAKSVQQMIGAHALQKHQAFSALNVADLLKKMPSIDRNLYSQMFSKNDNWQNVQFRFSIDGRSAVKGTSDAKIQTGLHIPLIDLKPLVQEAKLSALALTQEKIINSFQALGRSSALSQRLNEFSERVCNLGGSDLQGAVARAQLADLKAPPEFPLLNHYLDKFKHDVAWFTHYSDGAAKTELSISDQYNIARCCEWLFSVGVNPEYAKNIVNAGCQKKMIGFECLAGSVKQSWLQSIGNELRLSGAVLNPVNFKEETIRSHPFNQTISQFFEFCTTGDFANAYQLVEVFPDGVYKEQLQTIYQNAFEIIYNRYGVERKFENDPLFAKLVPSLEQSKIPSATNSIFIQRHEAYEKVISQLPSKDVSPLAQEMVWHVVDRLTDGSFNSYDTAVYFCNRLSSDSSDQATRQAYHQFFDEKGLLRFLNPESGFSKSVNIPESIHIGVHTQERVILNVLANIKTTAVDKPHIEQTMRYVVNACNDSLSGKEYRTLAQEMVDALLKNGHDRTLLKCGDFSGHSTLLRDVSDIINQRNKLDLTNSEYPKFNSAIELLDFARTAQSTGNDKLANKCIQQANDILKSPYIPVTSVSSPRETQKPTLPSSDVYRPEINVPDSANSPSEPKWYEKIPLPKLDQIFAAAVVRAVEMNINQPSYSQYPEYKNSQPDVAGAPEICPAGCQDFLNEIQPIISSGAQATATDKAKEKKDDCNEPATKIPEAVQKLLAEAANAYFRERIAEKEEEIIKLIEAKLKEKGLVYPYPIMIKDIDMAHVMFPDWNERKRKPKGFHSDRWCPERVIRVITPKGKLGTWYGDWQLNCIEKDSTFFPSEWDEKTIIDKIIESLLDIKHVVVQWNGLRMHSKTSEGIIIECIVHHGGRIATVYPALNDSQGNLCIY